MSTAVFRGLLAALAALVMMASPASAQRSDGRTQWVLLGQQKVGFVKDRDVIQVDRSIGWLKTLRVSVENNDVHMESFRIVYQNGHVEDFNVSALIREGTQSPPIDLRGERSFIDRIEMKYRSRLSFDGQAVVKVFGEVVRQRGPDHPVAVAAMPSGRWDKLGEQRVGLSTDRDVIRVGRQEGRFTGILLKVQNNDVEILDVTAIYGNGQRDKLSVRRVVPQGGHTGLLDLQGSARALDRVELTYRSRPGFRGQAVVELWGLHPAEHGRGGGGGGGFVSPGGRWDSLGSQKVGFGVDRDVVRVGRGEGRFDALVLHVRGNDIELLDAKVVYASGKSDNVAVRKLIRAGSQSDVFRIQGNRGGRRIDRIELTYRSRPGFGGEAVVEVMGRHAD